MKTAFCLLLACVLALCALPALSEENPAFYQLPSNRYSPELAQQALAVSELCYAVQMQQLYLRAQGFEPVGQYNYARAEDDARHVAAYTMYDQALADGGTAVIIAVRGTGEGEWPLNMDVMPSGDYDLPYAENFYLAARDILDTHAEYLSGLQSPVFLVTGHSRGAAVANLLAAALSDCFGAQNVYGYTFATPRTVRGDDVAYSNIFNVINPCDLVTYLPLPQWGFYRLGTDIVLPVDSATPEQLALLKTVYDARGDKTGELAVFSAGSGMTVGLVELLAGVSPTMAEGYTVRHALAHAGPAAEGEPGMTSSELLLMLLSSSLFSGGSAQISKNIAGQINDFTPLLMGLFAFLQSGEAAALGCAHMPAVYGAWMTVAEGE